MKEIVYVIFDRWKHFLVILLKHVLRYQKGLWDRIWSDMMI